MGPASAPLRPQGEVDTVDGFVLALSPWAVPNVRFDESLGRLHGYDFDFCLQVRAPGRKVVTADFRVIHNHSLDLVTNPDTGSRPTCRSRTSGPASCRRKGGRCRRGGRSVRAAPRPSAMPRTRPVEALQAEARAVGMERGLAEATTSEAGGSRRHCG